MSDDRKPSGPTPYLVTAAVLVVVAGFYCGAYVFCLRGAVPTMTVGGGVTVEPFYAFSNRPFLHRLFTLAHFADRRLRPNEWTLPIPMGPSPAPATPTTSTTTTGGGAGP